MKLSTALASMLIAGAGLNAQAALSPTATLNFDNGSVFQFESIASPNLTSFDGIILGTVQTAANSHFGLPDGSELPGIDQPWSYFGNTGMHLTSSPVTILSDDLNGNVTLDFSGWEMIWNGIGPIPLGGGAYGSNPDGVAILTCGNTCGNLDTFALYYTATIPLNSVSGLGGVKYQLGLDGNLAPAFAGASGLSAASVLLTGTISAVPVPAAFWLFASGLLGLGAMRRRRHH